MKLIISFKMIICEKSFLTRFSVASWFSRVAFSKSLSFFFVWVSFFKWRRIIFSWCWFLFFIFISNRCCDKIRSIFDYLIKFLNFMNWIWIKKSINKMNFILLNFFETSISKSSKWCLFKNFLSLILILSLIKCLIFLTMFLNRQFLSNWKMLSD